MVQAPYLGASRPRRGLIVMHGRASWLIMNDQTPYYTLTP